MPSKPTNPFELDEIPWHGREAEYVLNSCTGSAEGLTREEAARRLASHGENRLPTIKRTSPLVRFLDQFNNLLIYVLLIAAGVTALLQHWIDTGVIVGVVIINAIIGFIQEGKAERALDAIRNMLSHEATVLRGGHQITLAAEQLVPGDIVLLCAGDKVPADLRLLHVHNLGIDEATLTGESLPVNKTVSPVSEITALADRKCMAYSGTLVTSGQAEGVAVATGAKTEIGRINAMLREVTTITTPLLRQIDQFGRWLTLGILVLAVATLLFGVIIQHYSLTDMFLAGVGLAVAAIPEGLPAIITITLAIGVQRMAKRNAIIRRLPAVETLGSVTVICSDKTGTLTKNEMTVQQAVTAEQKFQVTGVGYDPHGTITLDGRLIQPENHPLLTEMARAAVSCNDASLLSEGNRTTVNGDPTEGALLTFALKSRIDKNLQLKEYPRTDVIPFESEHKFMATLHHDHAGHGFIYCKGAPERILDMCKAQRQSGQDHPLDVAYWHRCIDEMATRGQRLLAIAFKPAASELCELRFSDVEGGLSLLGLVGISDPPREAAIHAVKACHSAGIQVKMITGDHVATACAIAQAMNIGVGREALSGADLEAMDEQTLHTRIPDIDVFARTTPEQKLRLVQALQANGDVVAMTGDGVNDAPALKRADVGAAMGRKGTEVAKEASEMVLADDNFASISHAVEEGRTVYDNIKKSILFILPTNGGEALSIMAATAMGVMLPITPVQILWVNMITAVTLALSLAFEPPEHAVMARPPRNPREPILSAFLIWRIVFVSIILVSGTFGLFLWSQSLGLPIEEARTVAVNTLVMFEAFYLFNSRYILAPVFSVKGLTENPYVLIAVVLVIFFQMLYTYTPPMQTLFASTALSLHQWLLILLVSCSVLFLVETEKWLIRRFSR
ncbi:MAG: HAD-IC family P-type ATPase [Gammaproteobacteria bacterium]|nr:HAD-IC family P-type ATPase [Gammaproteobacteria bacterium]